MVTVTGYKFIPKNEIWIDDANKKSEIKYVILHEIVESYYMRKGMSYSRAHNKANIIEEMARADKLLSSDIIKIIRRGGYK